MADYHVGAGCFGIYAGTLNKKGNLWQNKTECTDEAIMLSVITWYRSYLVVLIVLKHRPVAINGH